MVKEFNGERYIPYMVLSLKAGGVGLNLTAANHVIILIDGGIPAVENQATDRAFRIGQTQECDGTQICDKRHHRERSIQ